jgi:1-deoxy-D-xylulose-5-phosphate synthase
MVDKSKYKYIFNVDSPGDIKNFSVLELKGLCSEIRQYMIDVISQVGGHFGGGLGTVELTVALHKVFDTPNDSLGYRSSSLST